MNINQLFEKQYSIKTLRLLWIVLPFLPLCALSYNIFSYGSIAITLVFVYFFPVCVVVYAFAWLHFVLPNWFDPALRVGIYLLCIGYCGLIAYGLDRKLKVLSSQFSLAVVSSIYSAVLIPLLFIFLYAAGVPASHEMPIFALKEQTHLWRELKSYKHDYTFLDRQYFIRVEYEDGFVEGFCVRFGLKPYDVEEIPNAFWYKLIVWWQPRIREDAQAFISERFDFHKRGSDGQQYFLYVMPSERICYIWYKSNF